MSVTTTKVHTVGMKRRGVVRVLKSAMHDAAREVGTDRVVGIFGVLVRENGEAHLLSALTVDEMRIVMRAVPPALQTIASSLVKGTGTTQ